MSDTAPFSTVRNPESNEQVDGAAVCHPPPAQVTDDFFNMSLVSFQVENTVFRVIKHGFDIPGSIFEAMFTLPTSFGNEEGSSNDNPIHLDGIRADHFRAFLRVLYPFRGRPPVTEFDDWLGVLILSAMWRFTEIRAEAIETLSKQIQGKSALERIALGRRYMIADWTRSGYTDLLQQPTLTLKELSEDSFALDWNTIAKIYSIRDTNYTKRQTASETFFGHNCGYNHTRTHCPYGYAMPAPVEYGLDFATAIEGVKTVFREELDEMEIFEKRVK